MSREARRRAMDAIWNLEKQTSVTELMKLFKADLKAALAFEALLKGCFIWAFVEGARFHRRLREKSTVPAL